MCSQQLKSSGGIIPVWVQIALMLWIALHFGLAADTVKDVPVKFVIPTMAPNNREAVFHCRVPKGYEEKRSERYRVLVYFGGRNTTGENEAKGEHGWDKWADENGIFILCPGFRDDDYWEPAKWSMDALLRALAQLKRTYNVCTARILYFGYSAGSQASNLFAAWRPALCRAWAAAGCGLFHQPHPGTRGMPGLVTCGEADQKRYLISRSFVRQAHAFGEPVIFQTTFNGGHEVASEAMELARAFLKFYHDFYRNDLLNPPAPTTLQPTVKYIGDDMEGCYYEASSPQVKNIRPEDRVFFPDLSIARAWGEPGD